MVRTDKRTLATLAAVLLCCLLIQISEVSVAAVDKPVADDQAPCVFCPESAELDTEAYYRGAVSGVSGVINDAVFLLAAVASEVRQIQGASMSTLLQSIENRMVLDRTARVIWLLTFAIAATGSLFLLSVLYGFAVRAPILAPPASSADARRERVAHRPEAEPVSKRLHASLGTLSLGELVQSGSYEKAEAAFRASLKHRPEEVGAYLYLFACTALADDAGKYTALVADIFPDGLNASKQLHLHIADMGRAVAPDEFPLASYPLPRESFELKAELIDDSLGTISEFGDVQTLLDLIKAYIEMQQPSQARHLIVEVLVRGDSRQREQALKMAGSLSGAD